MTRLCTLTLLVAMLSALSARAETITLGEPSANFDQPGAVGGVDGWQAVGVIRYDQQYTNSSGSSQTITPGDFKIRLPETRGGNGVVTPALLLKVPGMGDTDVNNYPVMAIGTSRVSAADWPAAGVHTFPFSDDDASFTLEDGQTIVTFAMDSYADGTPGGGSTIPFAGPGAIALRGGGGTGDNVDALVLGSPPSGQGTTHNGNRGYQFNISFDNTPVIPEPTTAVLAMICAGGLGIFGSLRRRRRRR
jgi:hypothetical protein